jgi:hypothetical protein
VKGVRTVRHLNQCRTWHITAYIWRETSIGSYHDLDVEWVALSAVWSWKVSLVDQICGFYSASPIEMKPLVEITAFGAYIIARLACFNLEGHVCIFSILKALKTNCYFRFYFNRQDENYWLTLNVHPEDGSSRFFRSFHYHPAALLHVTSPKTIRLENYSFALVCLRIIRW